MTHRFQNALKAGLHYFCLALCLCFSLTLGGCSFSSTAPKACDVQASLPVEEMDLSDVPTYDGDLVVTIHQNRPFNIPDSPSCSNEYLYSKLDDLGRTQQAYAFLSSDSLTDSARGDISSIKPTGFINHAYDWIDGGTVYNRSHLIAHMLGGADIEDNLMTGTRSFNAFGMLPYEQKVQSYLNEEDGVVFYRVSPLIIPPVKTVRKTKPTNPFQYRRAIQLSPRNLKKTRRLEPARFHPGRTIRRKRSS